MPIRRIKALIKTVAPGAAEKAAQLYNSLYHTRYRGRPISDVFTDIYRRNHWRDATSVSGPGSTIEQTAAVRAALPELCRRLGVKSLLDAPCGDFHWMSQVDLGIETYVGMDIVPDLVDATRAKHARDGRSFRVGDLTRDPLPKVDLVFCRDCLVHLSYDDIERVVRNVKASGATYLLTTSFRSHENRDITTGNWRPINLERAPFGFPSPLEVIDERCTEGDGRYADKCLLLFRVAELPERLAR